MKKIILVLLVLINIGAFIYVKYLGGASYSKLDTLVFAVIILIALILSFNKYLIWTIGFLGSIGLIILDSHLVNTSSCSNIGCGIKIGPIVSFFLISAITLILLIFQLIQYLIKKYKSKSKITMT